MIEPLYAFTADAASLMFIFKIVTLVFEVLFFIFTFIASRQVALFNDSFCTPAAPFFKLISNLQLLASVLLLIFTGLFL